MAAFKNDFATLNVAKWGVSGPSAFGSASLKADRQHPTHFTPFQRLARHPETGRPAG